MDDKDEDSIVSVSTVFDHFDRCMKIDEDVLVTKVN